jgi:ATP synthase protein I
MMTTERPSPRTAGSSPRRARALLGPLASASSLGLLLSVVAALVSGAPAAAGAVTGAALVCAVFAFGAVVLGVVASVAPAASLLVALLTYTLQVLLVGLVYLALSTGGALDGPVDGRWLSAAVIACTLTWTATQVVVVTRTRQPLYDLPAGGGPGEPRGGRPGGTEASVG